MAKIKIGDTRKIELLDAIKNPSAINFKIGDKYAELTDDITKTNGSPQLSFTKDGVISYIREIFETSGSFSFRGLKGTKNITSFFPSFSSSTKIKSISIVLDGVHTNTSGIPELGNFSKVIYEMHWGTFTLFRSGEYIYMKYTSDFSGTANVNYTIE